MSDINPKVLVIMGSKSDYEVIAETEKLLSEFGISNEVHIASAHRTPDKVLELSTKAQERGIKVIIAAAGLAAHLAGVIAAHTTLPVIGVPLEGSSLGGLDSLLSVVQMPQGVPVATVAIGKHGARNAAVLAAQILALFDDAVAYKLKKYRETMSDAVLKTNLKGK